MAPTLPSTSPDDRAASGISPLVEELGLGDALRNRAKNANAPAHRLATKSTETTENEMSGSSLLASGCDINAPMASGASGAHVERANQSQQSFHIKEATFIMNTTQETKVSSNHTLISPGRLDGLAAASAMTVDPALGSSATFNAGAVSKTSTAIITSMDAGTDQAKGLSTTLESPTTATKSPNQHTVVSANEAPMTTPPTIEEYAAQIKAMGKRAEESYNEIVPLLYRHSPASTDQDELYRLICTQRGMFAQRNRSFVESVRRIFLGGSESEELLSGACRRVDLALGNLQQQLNIPQSRISKHSSKMTDGRKKPNVNFMSLFVEWETPLKAKYDEYIEAVSVLPRDGGHIHQADLRQVMEKLTTEARASSNLKQCLCRACPEHCHTHHTAYLSLEPDTPHVSPEQLTENNHRIVLAGSSEATWHMAFKSTIAKMDTLIWLKVVSTVVVETSSSSSSPRSVVQLPSRNDFHDSAILNTQTTEREDPEYVPDYDEPRKRRASSTPLEPPCKLQMTKPGQGRRMTDSGLHLPSGIEVCPEYLMQHDTAECAIIKMTDSSGCDYRIYYLPQAKRSAYGARAKDITLRQVLNNRHDKKYKRSWNLLWIVRLARLVAEAVVRFDLRNSDTPPDESIVFYGVDKKDSDWFLSPFLEVKIKKPKTPTSSLEAVRGTDLHQPPAPERHHVLLNLGLILLQLGTKRDTKLEKPPAGPDDIQNYISLNANKTATGVHQKYADAVQNCAWFFGNQKAMEETVFRDKFFKKILQPLKYCETIIDKQEKAGKRLPPGTAGVALAAVR